MQKVFGIPVGSRAWPLTALIAMGVMTVGLFGCATTNGAGVARGSVVDKKVEAINYTLNSAAWKPAPECMWIKPFIAVEQFRTPAGLTRKSVWAQVAVRGYTLAALDDPSPSTACDYVLEGEITDAKRDFMVFFSTNSIGAKVKLVRQSTREVLWTSQDIVDLKDGGLPLSFIGLSSGVWAASENMQTDRYLMAVDALSRRLVASLPYRMVKPVESARAVTWPKNLDDWLAGVPELDREQALLDLMSRPLSPMQSEAAFARLVRVSPTPANWREWVVSRVQRAETERALALFDFPDNQLREDPQSNYLKARVLASLRRYEEAVLPLMEAIKRNPHEPMFYEALAHVEVQRQEKSRAIAAFTKVVALDPTQAYAWLNIGLLAQASGDSALALDALREASALYLASEDTSALNSLLDVLKEMNDAGNPEAGVLAKKIASKRTLSSEAS